jgi:uncharacterized protein
MTSSSRGNYMYTVTGDAYYPFDPRENEVNIETIAHHLANQCRFNGAVQSKTDGSKIFYSVAEHSYVLSKVVPRELAKAALLHDAAEAYLHDMIRPLKYHPDFKEAYQRVEALNQAAIAKKFKIANFDNPLLKKMDNILCITEISQMIKINPSHPTYAPQNDETEKFDLTLAMLCPLDARQHFMQRYDELFA